MSVVKRIYQNTLYLSIAEVISRVLQFAVMLWAARYLVPQEFGAFNFALALAFVAMIVADMGLSQLLVRTVARDRQALKKYLINALYLKAWLCVLMFFLLWGILLGLGYRDQTLDLALLMLIFAILGTFTEFIYSIFRSFERMEFDSMLKITRMALLALLSFIVLVRGYGVLAFSWMFVVVEFIVVLLGFLIVSKNFRVHLTITNLDSVYRIKMLKDAIPFGLAALFGNSYFYLAIFILSVMKGELEVAYYSSAYNIALALLFIPTVFTNALYPVLSRSYTHAKQQMTTLYEKGVKYLLIISLPIGLVLLVYAEHIMHLLYGQRYDMAIIVLRMFAFFVLLKFINFMLGMTLSSTDRQWERMKAQGMVAGLNVLICMGLIWGYGYKGAAWGVLITEVVLLAVYYNYARQAAGQIKGEVIARPLFAGMIMLVCLIFISIHWIMSIFIAGAVYVIALVAVGAFDKEDQKIWEATLKK